jgi:parvulin-like peptidyl-prolyl isomerase
MMGQHKPAPVDQLAPQVVKALLAMKPGDVSDLIQVDQAYTIVRLK